MKNILKIFFALTIISCNSDREELPEEITLVGTWKIEKTTTISGADNKTLISESFPDTCKQKSTYQFTADQKYVVTDFNSTVTGCDQSALTSSYSYDDVQKILTIGTATSQVQELTANQLVTYVADNYDSNGDGINDFLRYSFKR